jgi:hypothetical protein
MIVEPRVEVVGIFETNGVRLTGCKRGGANILRSMGDTRRIFIPLAVRIIRCAETRTVRGTRTFQRTFPAPTFPALFFGEVN